MPKVPPAAALATPDYWDEACKHLSRRDRVMKRLIPKFGDACLQSRGDAFTTLARSIVGQQISVKAAQSVWDRFVALLAGAQPAAGPGAVLALAPPQMRGAGLSARKVRIPARPGAPLREAARCTSGSGSRWTTRPSSPSWWPSAASAAGRPRCS
jgi:hypothetical protein